MKNIPQKEGKTAENQDGYEREGINGTCGALAGTDFHGKVVIQAENTRSSR